jgi:hypothetical protein
MLEQGIRVCGDVVCGRLVGEEGAHQGLIREWFRRVIGIPCRLVRQADGMRKTKRADDGVRGGHHKSNTATAAALSGNHKNNQSFQGAQAAWGTAGHGILGSRRADHTSPGSRSISQDGGGMPRHSRGSASSPRSPLSGFSTGAQDEPHHEPPAASFPSGDQQEQQQVGKPTIESPTLGQQERAPSGFLGFANDGQYLLINAASLADLNARLATSGRESKALDERRFRPNLVVSGFEAYEEDRWIEVKVRLSNSRI